MDFQPNQKTRNALAQLQDFMDRNVYPNEAEYDRQIPPIAALRIIDDAIQAHGGAGVTSDFELARACSGMRALRLADGPDEVHRRTIARLELRKQAERAGIALRRS